jgi:pyruvate formate lyase activating enzyme
LLKKAKKEFLHTALDTTGFISWELLQGLLELVDLVLYDVKHLDSISHLQWTGRDNHLILENLKKIAASERPDVWIRVAVIPGFNDSKKHVRALKKFFAEVHPQKISLLPYHIWGLNKYEKLGSLYQLQEVPLLKEEEMGWIRDELADCGVQVEVGR